MTVVSMGEWKQKREQVPTPPTPQDTDDLIADMRSAAAALNETTDRLAELVEILPEILPDLVKGTDDARTSGRAAPGSGGGPAAARPYR